jgi:hypothetical protein
MTNPSIARGVRGGVAATRYRPAVVEQGRIVNVNVRDWSVDVAGEFGNKLFLDIEVASPYLHIANGEGIYVMPEVGALCWVCMPSTGNMAPPFVLGFAAGIDERKDEDGNIPANFRGGRQNLNPGDIMLRTRDENFVILRRGGVVQIGATPIAQRLFIPVRNIIRDMCENYDLFSLAGEMTWSVDRTDQTTDGSAPTLCSLKVKNKANEPEHAALLTIGSHKDQDELTLNLLIKESGATGAATMIQMQMTKTGNVLWQMEGAYETVAKKSITLTAEEESFIAQALKGEMILKAAKSLLMEAGEQWSASATKEAIIKASKLIVQNDTDIDGKVNLGKNAAHPVALADELVIILTKIIDGFVNAGKPHGLYIPVPGTPILFPGLASIAAELNKILSQNTKTA